MFLLDTNICICLMKGSYPKLTQRLWTHSPSEIAVSAVTVYELEYGALKSRWGADNMRKLRQFLAPFAILPFDSDSALAAGALRAFLEKKGTPIGPNDLQIAAQGLAGGHTVITHNTGEFQRVPNLKLDDWTE